MRFDQFQISFPAWGPPNDCEMLRFFGDVSQEYPQARFLHYNTDRGRRILKGKDYIKIAEVCPNLIATKSGGHSISTLLGLTHTAPQLLHFVTELSYGAAGLLGLECGLLVSVSGINPAKSLEFFRAGCNGNLDTVRRLTFELNSIRNKVMEIVTATGGHMDGAFDKMYARLLDAEFPLALKSPYQAPETTDFETFAEWLETEFPDWFVGRT
ncbi:MAG: hypothetical protein KGZ25_12600 [Planctomycetes bacterium]|nr:hypothetical protein [Planctomycetota bacterium]